MLIALRRIELHELPRLLLCDLRADGHVHIRRGQITIVFRDFVFANHVIPKSLPCHFVGEPMILVPIGSSGRKDQMWNHIAAHRLQEFLCLRKVIGQMRIGKRANAKLAARFGADKRAHRFFGFQAPRRRRRKNGPVNATAIATLQCEQGGAAADFNVVAMRAYAKNLEPGCALLIGKQIQHDNLSARIVISSTASKDSCRSLPCDRM
jgi:hypothetical protein